MSGFAAKTWFPAHVKYSGMQIAAAHKSPYHVSWLDSALNLTACVPGWQVTPVIGQGCNSALEDCVVLDSVLESTGLVNQLQLGVSICPCKLQL